MRYEKKGYAIVSGIFLLLPLALVLRYFYMFRVLLSDPGSLLFFAGSVFLPGLVGVFLLLRKPGLAAAAMSLVAVAVLLMELPQIPRYLEPNGYLATYDEASGYTEYIPRQFVVVPTLDILGALLFAAALWLRGKAALILALLSALAELAYLICMFASSGYVTGHLGPNALFPLQLALAAVFAGLWLLSRKEPPAADKPD